MNSYSHKASWIIFCTCEKKTNKQKIKTKTKQKKKKKKKKKKKHTHKKKTFSVCVNSLLCNFRCTMCLWKGKCGYVFVLLNRFTPEFLKWTLPSLKFGMFIIASRVLAKKENRMANNVDQDETANYEPSHLDLRCFKRYMFWSAGLKGLTYNCAFDIRWKDVFLLALYS